MSRIISILIAGALLAGCAKEPPAPVAIDTFCITSKKRSWSIEDSPESIRAAEVHNRTIDLRCGVPGKVASAS